MVPQDGRGPGALGRRSNPGWQSGSRTWCCRGCSVGHKCFSDLIPGQETVYVMWDGQKEGGKKKKILSREPRICQVPADFLLLLLVFG